MQLECSETCEASKNFIPQIKGYSPMKPTKLKMCITISQTIAQHGPLEITQILPKTRTSISLTSLNEFLDFLISQCVIESSFDGKTELSYSITERGMKILRYFNCPTQPMTDLYFGIFNMENPEETTLKSRYQNSNR